MIDYLNIGLDFGTHQSKVCIEDTADPRNRIYTFFKFLRPDGTKTFFLPSVVQINKDNTVSYGFVDESKAKILGQKHSFDEPQFVKPQEPKYLKILSAGGSEAPEKILSEAGIDIRSAKFWQGGFDVLSTMVDELEKL